MEIVKIKRYGSEGLEPQLFKCNNGSCVGSSGDNTCGHYQGEINNTHIKCVNPLPRYS